MAYLACGRPVVALDTGWSCVIGEHAGLRAFTTAEQAARAIAEIEDDYEEASRSALELSSRLFGADRVISDLLPALELDGSPAALAA